MSQWRSQRAPQVTVNTFWNKGHDLKYVLAHELRSPFQLPVQSRPKLSRLGAVRMTA